MSHNFIIVNGDTDGLAFKKPDESPITTEERAQLLKEVNALMPHGIVWKDDNYYRRMIVFAAKNYVMDDGKKLTIKGNSLKATKKAPALRAFIREIVDLLLKDRKEQAIFAYLNKAKEISRITDIGPWCSKYTVTKKVLNPEGTFQKKIRAAIGDKPVSEGDKVYMFYLPDGSLCLRENFTGEFDADKLLGSLFDTMKVFRRVLDVELFPDLTLKRNRELLIQLGLREVEQKKVVYSRPASPETFSAENVLKQLIADKDRLSKAWGSEVYNTKLKLLKEYIDAKPSAQSKPSLVPLPLGVKVTRI